MIRFLVTAVALFGMFSIPLRGQFYLTGESPASLKWKSITTRNFKIIYPANLSEDAVLLAGKLESAVDSTGDLEFSQRKRFPVLLQNGSVLSNGYVALAPRRMELQITPPQDSYSQDWLSQLSLHEFRHVAQLNKLNQGVTRVSGWFSGEIARSVVSSLVPSWFFEGDAVYFETKLSFAGRGRTAGFEMPLRALLTEEQKPYTFNKAIFGSFRDFVPDYYLYGHKLTGYLRSQYGPHVWSDALDYVSKKPFLIWPFSFHLKKNYGFYKTGLYQKTIDSLIIQYTKEKAKHTYSKTTNINRRLNETFTSYLHPKPWGDYTVAYRKGFDDPGSIILIDSSGNEKRVLMTGKTVSDGIDVFESRVIWDELSVDPRWGKRDYSVIKEIDLVSGKKRKLTRKTRFFSPDYSPDGSLIAVAENNKDNENFLTILDASSGKVNRRIPAGSKAVLMPEWAGCDDILVITVSEAGKQLESVNLNTETWKVYVPYTSNNLFDPVNCGSYILFRAEDENVENIFAIHKETGEIFRITRTPYGIRFPELSADKGKLMFSEYSAKGFDISWIQNDSSSWERFTQSFNTIPLTDHETSNFINENPRPYYESAHLFRFHSWLPFYVNPDELMNNPLTADIGLGFIAFSQNLLGTAISSIGYNYSKGYHYFHPAFTWRGWYPVIQFRANAGGPQHYIPGPDGMKIQEINQFPVDFELRSHIPLIFSRGAYTTTLRPEIGWEYISLRHYDKESLRKGINLVHLRFHTANYRRMSVRDLMPVWGQSLTSTLTFQPFGNQYGHIYSFRLNLFFPGIAKHHHFYLTAGYQAQKRGTFIFPYARINFPRGHDEKISQSFSSLLINYAFPVFYPDLSLGSVLYLKRLKTNFFFDTGYGDRIRIYDPVLHLYTGFLASTGTEISVDLHAFRFLFPISAGIRIGYKMPGERMFSEFILGLSTTL